MASFFTISNDPGDESAGRLANRTPGFRVFWDFELTIAKLCGAVPTDADPLSGALSVSRFWLVLDPTLRVIAKILFKADGSDLTRFFALMESLPAPERFAGIELQAPVLYWQEQINLKKVQKHEQQTAGIYRRFKQKTSGQRCERSRCWDQAAILLIQQ